MSSVTKTIEAGHAVMPCAVVPIASVGIKGDPPVYNVKQEVLDV